MSGGVSGKADASDEDDDNEFFDAMEEPAEFITVPADPKYHRYKLIFSIVRRFSFPPHVFCFILDSYPLLQEIWQQHQWDQQ